MNYIITLIITLTAVTLTMAQQTDPTISIIDGNCSGNDLYVDGTPLTALDDCSYETPLVMSGNTYSLAAVNNSSADLSGISTIDLVILQRGLLYGFDDNASIYKADYDHDGAVSTYDIVKLRSVILGITTQANYHVIPTDFDIPTLDPFDIQVNYSSLEFTTDDYTQNLMTVKILKLGDLR